MANLRKIGLKIWEYLALKLPSEGGSMSLTPTSQPLPPRKVYIFCLNVHEWSLAYLLS